MTHATIDGVRYEWRMTHRVKSLYRSHIISESLIPEGMVMTLRNRRNETLVLRGEQHGETIAFIHVCGEGGNVEIGHWSPVEMPEPLEDFVPRWAQKLRNGFAELGGTK